MDIKSDFFLNWIINMPCHSINKAYNLSLKIRNIHIHYMWYKYNRPIESSNLKIVTYLNIIFKEYALKIYWALIEFQLTQFFFTMLTLNFFKIRFFTKLNTNNSLVSYVHENNLFLMKSLKINKISIDNFKKKIIWIEAVLSDLDIKQDKRFLYTLRNILALNSTNTNSIKSNKNLLEIIPYESVGLVPRSITRTLMRFQNELFSLSPSIILVEFRLLKYQAIASLQYLLYLIIGPWVISEITKIFVLRPIIINYWNISQNHIFLNVSQEEEALTRLQQIEELIWLDIILNNTTEIPLQDLSISIHQKTLELVTLYNDRSINTLLNLFTDLIQFLLLILILIFGKKRLAILNSWIQEVFYSLSDTMKAFFILLCTDLCIGFHSPHGWEIFIAYILDHLGFSNNPYIISCLVSTFPVILDTVFKYWIFRHLNRISPSIVVTYHTMNE